MNNLRIHAQVQKAPALSCHILQVKNELIQTKYNRTLEKQYHETYEYMMT